MIIRSPRPHCDAVPFRLFGILSVSVAGRPDGCQDAAFEPQEAYEFPGTEIEDHLRDDELLVIAAVYARRRTDTESIGWSPDDVRSQHVAEVPDRRRLAAERDDAGLVHTLQDQPIATAKRMRRLAA